MKKLILSLTITATLASFGHAGPIEDLAASIQADYDSIQQTPQSQREQHDAEMVADMKRRDEQLQKERDDALKAQTKIREQNQAQALAEKNAAKFPATLEDAKAKMIELFDIPKETIYAFSIDETPVHRASISWITYRATPVAGHWEQITHGRSYNFDTQTLTSQYDS